MKAEKPKARIGRVVGDKMNKTRVVAVERQVSHPLYKKILRRIRKYKAHDEDNASKKGDWVRIVEARPLSREKRWRVAEVITRGEVVELPPQLVEEPLLKAEEVQTEEQTTVEAEPASMEEAEATPPAEEKKDSGT